MPSSIVQGILEILLQGLLEVVGYFVGSVVVPVVSFGRLKCDRLAVGAPRKRIGVAGLYYRRGQQIYLTAEATQLAGLLTLLLCAGAGVLIWYLRKA